VASAWLGVGRFWGLWLKGMGDKEIAGWEQAKQDFLGARRTLHEIIGPRTRGIYGEMLADWIRFKPAGKAYIRLLFGPKLFNPSDHEPDGTAINDRLDECYRALGDLERLTRTLLPDERDNLDLRELSDSELRLLRLNK
jgi:hypothetical protein